MSLKRQTVTNYYLYDTPVENLFISEYMAAAPGSFVKAYLLALMYAQLSRPYDPAELSAALSMTEEQLEECWDYWQRQGLISKRSVKIGGKAGYNIEFKNIKEKLFGGAAEETESSTSPLNNDEIRRLLSDVENTCGRLIEGSEAEAIASWICDFGFSPELILRAYRYCTENRKSNRYKYVLTVLKDWKKHGVDGTDKVDEYLAAFDVRAKRYKEVLRQIGQFRNPAEQEKVLIDSWFEELGFDMQTVAKACGKTSGISNPNINYVDKVLRSWYEDKAGTSPAAKADLAAGVMALYEQDREENKRKAEERKKEIFVRIPEAAEMSRQITELTRQVSRSLLGGGAKTQKIKEEVSLLRARREDLLKANGYDADALEIQYTCSICKDTGTDGNGRKCSCYRLKEERLRAESFGSPDKGGADV